MSNIKDRFKKQEDAWIELNSVEECLEFCTEMVVTSTNETTIRIFAKSLKESIFSNRDFIKTLSVFADLGGKIKILTSLESKGEIKESALLVRAAFYQFVQSKCMEVKITRTVYNMNDKDGNNIPIDFMLSQEAFYVEPHPQIVERPPLSCAKDATAVQQLRDLYDSVFTREETEKLDLVAILGLNK